MTFKERIDNEKDNLTKIVLYNDRGLFFNLVERSAYAFCTRIKPFKVHVKTLKGLKDPFVSIGVPVEKVDDYLQGMQTEKDEQGNIMATLQEPVDENAFQAWKKHIIEEYNAKGTVQKLSDVPDAPIASGDITDTNDNSVIRRCFQEVKSLNIASMTPMEAMIYLNGLQQKLKDVKL